MINEVNPDIMVLNEASPKIHSQNASISSVYDMVDPYFRDADGNEDYSTVILYRKDLFELTDYKTYCLTNTPTVYSKVEGSYHYRFATFAYFKSIATGKTFVVVGTHFENNSTNSEIYQTRNASRILQAGHLLNLMSQKISSGVPVMVLGDLNSVIRTSADAEDPKVRFGGVNELLDSGKLVTSAAVAQSTSTAASHTNGMTLDYILLTPDDFTVWKYSVQKKFSVSRPSDHYPVVVELEY